MRIRDDHMHKAVRRHRVFPRIGFVDTGWGTVFGQQQILWTLDVPKVRAIKRRTRCDLAVWFRMGRRGLGVRRFEPHPAGGFHRAKQDLQNV